MTGSRILLELLTAIGGKKAVEITHINQRRTDSPVVHTVCPLKIFISTQGGRQYLLCYHYRFRKMMFFRLDYIQKVESGADERNYARYESFCRNFLTHLWGTSTGIEYQVDHLEMTLHFTGNEQHIPQRLEREKRNGRVELVDANTVRYIADVYDASEMLPWLRTFIGRIERLECSDEHVVKKFYDDLAQMYTLYGGEE